eukprot:530671-Prorocentrum_minimum.AAC.1
MLRATRPYDDTTSYTSVLRIIRNVLYYAPVLALAKLAHELRVCGCLSARLRHLRPQTLRLLLQPRGWIRAEMGWIRAEMGWIRAQMGWIRAEMGWNRAQMGWIRAQM